MSKTLIMVFAGNCGACKQYKVSTLPQVQSDLNKNRVNFKIYELTSTHDDPSMAGVPPFLAKYVKWFPFFALISTDNILSVFAAKKDINSDNWIYDQSLRLYPTSENLIKFYNNSGITSIPTPGYNTPLPKASNQYIPTSACSRGFKGRLV